MIPKGRKGGASPQSRLSRPKHKARAKRRRRPRLKLYAMHWNQLNASQKLRRRSALTVLDRMRGDASFSAACRQEKIGRNTVLRYLDGAVYRRRRRIKARKHDHLLRNMEMNSEGHILFVELNDSSQATKLSLYHSAIKSYLEGDVEPLSPFKDDGITDSANVFHKFETNAKTIINLYERMESFPEEYEIYQQ